MILWSNPTYSRSAGLTGSLMTTSSPMVWEEGIRPDPGWLAAARMGMAGDRIAPPAGRPVLNYILSIPARRNGGFSAQAGYTGNKGNTGSLQPVPGRIQHPRAAHIGNTTDLQAAIQADEPWIQNPFTYELLNPRQTSDPPSRQG